MNVTAIIQGSNELKIVELYVIENKYKKLIASNPILKSDFHKLLKYISSSETSSSEHCTKIISHLIAELNEFAEDNQRMGGEGSVYIKRDSEAYRHIQEYHDLKQALKMYCAHYLAEQPI